MDTIFDAVKRIADLEELVEKYGTELLCQAFKESAS